MSNRRKFKPHFTVRAGKRLAAWARKSAAGTLSESEAEQMERLIEKYLSSGQDQVFEYALAELRENPKATEELLDWLELSSETLVGTSPDGKPVMALLFAVPPSLTPKDLAVELAHCTRFPARPGPPA